MKIIFGKEYLTRKEAARRYSTTVSWFKHKQQKHEEPHFIKIGQKGRTYYSVEKTDEWFRNNMKESE